MSFAREKRLWLGLLALLAPLPLPFNEMLEWPVLVLYALVSWQFLRRAWDGSERWLPNWALNLLGLAYLPILFADFALSGRGHLVKPVLHLILFGVTAKLWSLRRERDKWQTFIGLFFLFLAAMATSVHPSIVLYLLAFLLLSMATLMRFALLHLLASFGHRDLPATAVPMRAFLAVAALLTLVCAVPMFALLPRIRSAYILGPGGVEELRTYSSGFADEMSLDLIGRIRTNRAVALRMKLEGRYQDPGGMRFKAATYDVYLGRSWSRSEIAGPLVRSAADGTIVLAAGTPIGRAHMLLEPLRATSLVLPVEALRFTLTKNAASLDRGGAVFLRGMPSDTLDYVVELAGRPVLLGVAPSTEPRQPTLDRQGITPGMAELAHRWAATGTPAERAEIIERHLLQDFTYSDELLGRGGERPIEDFLLRTRTGHCEYFASGMVLLLRAEGIPARLVTGFLGAEYSYWEDLYVVRQSSAHAWVEAYLPDEGWRIFDPTPVDGRPVIAPRSLWLYTRQAWDAVVFRWDRYVLSYDFYDQIRALGSLRLLWDQFLRQLTGGDHSPAPSPVAAAPEGAPAVPEVATPALGARLRLWAAAGGLLVFVALAAFWILRRPAWTASLAYGLLRERLAAGGLNVPGSLAPVALARAAAVRFPEAAAPTRGVVALYLRESFAGERLAADELARVRTLLTEIDAALRTARRRRRDSPARR